MDRHILQSIGKPNPRVLIVPTAAALENPARAADNGVRHFAALGAEASSLMVTDAAGANDASLVAAVDHADLVYFAGGSPVHLLNVLRGSLLLQKVRDALDRGAIVAGSSAGAMVMGTWMRHGGWGQGLDIANGVVTFPHHERSDPDTASDDMALSGHQDVTGLGIDGETGCHRESEDTWHVLGSGSVTVYRNGSWSRYRAGDTFPA
jgi:cyanophycinase